MYPQTIEEFLYSPMGKDFTVVPRRSRELMVLDLRQRLLRLEKEKGKIKPKIYSSHDSLYFHLVIPSERLESELTYDVVVEMYPTTVSNGDYEKYHFRLFSNSPSFTYTYANMVYYYEMGVVELASRYSDIVLKEEAIVRNPDEIMLYEKSTTWALIIIQEFFERYRKFPISDKASQLKQIVRTDVTIHMESRKDRERIKRVKQREQDWEKKFKVEENRAGVINKVSRKPSLVTNPKKTKRSNRLATTSSNFGSKVKKTKKTRKI